MALDNNQARFVVGVSRATGLDPRVLVAWIQQEGANAPDGTGGYNYLNLSKGNGNVGEVSTSKRFANFGNVDASIESTVRRLNNPFARPILATARARGNPSQQIAAIAATGWDAARYGGPGGPNLRNTFSALFTPAALTGQALGPEASGGVAYEFGTKSAADWTSYDLNNLSKDLSIKSPLDFLKKLLEPDLWLRIGQVIGGAILLGMGLFLLMRQIGLAAPTTPLAAIAAAA